MEQPMLERAARAIVTRNWPSLCEADVSEMWPDHVEDARAVLLAIRESNEAMHRAGLFAYSQEERGIDGIYSAMIDAALI